MEEIVKQIPAMIDSGLSQMDIVKTVGLMNELKITAGDVALTLVIQDRRSSETESAKRVHFIHT